LAFSGGYGSDYYSTAVMGEGESYDGLKTDLRQGTTFGRAE
jgi:hypothetical protein